MLLSVFQRLLALMSLAVLAAGGYFAWSWWRLHEMLWQLPPGAARDPEDWRLWVAGGLFLWTLLGRLPLGLLLGKAGDDAGRMKRGKGRVLTAGDGAKLYVEADGPLTAPVLLLVHGWGLDAGMWWDARRALADRYQIVAYDLPGLGRSSQPADGHYSIERMADELHGVVQTLAPRQVILVGHSIGGMIVQTFCARHPGALGDRVAGIVLENTTHLDPTRTTILGKALHAIKPALEAVMHLDIWLQPLAWAMNWQGYLSGSTHIAMRFGGFGTTPTRAQLEQVALCATRNPPAVQAKGNLAMMRWQVTDALGRITVPALVFAGGRDIVTRPSAGETIVERMPLARAVHMAKAGHMGPMECARDYNRIIAEFADKTFLAAARRDVSRPAAPDGADSSPGRTIPASPAPSSGSAGPTAPSWPL